MENNFKSFVKDKPSRFHRFDNFIEYESNSAAVALAKLVAKGEIFRFLNILIIYGKSESGKTHLVEAIANSQNPNHEYQKSLFLRCETFIENLVKSTRENYRNELINYYLDHDMLIIDDVHLLKDKLRTSEAFGSILNRFLDENKIIVLTTNVLPNNLFESEKLNSILSKSVLVSVHTPGPETKIKILTRYLDEFYLNVPIEIISELVQDQDKNINVLLGNLITLVAKSSVLRMPITKDFAKENLINKIE